MSPRARNSIPAGLGSILALGTQSDSPKLAITKVLSKVPFLVILSGLLVHMTDFTSNITFYYIIIL